jgi:hypothetical protein
MSSETVTTNRVGRKMAWHRVTATGIVEGTPARFGCVMTLTLRNGTQKRCPLVVQVIDQALLQRLRLEALPGAEMRVYVETAWDTEGIPKVLKDFCLV